MSGDPEESEIVSMTTGEERMKMMKGKRIPTFSLRAKICRKVHFRVDGKTKRKRSREREREKDRIDGKERD